MDAKGKHKKHKKKSFFVKLFSHTTKKETAKHEYISINTLSTSIAGDEGLLFTYCDICNKEILTASMGDMIFHANCNSNSFIKVQDDVKSIDDFCMLNEEKKLDVDLQNGEDLEIGNNFASEDYNTIKLKSNTKVTDGVVTLKRRNSVLRNSGDRYVFSTFDLPSIRKSGFVPKLINEPIKEKELILDFELPRPSLAEDKFNQFGLNNLPIELRNYVEIFNSNNQGLKIETKDCQLMGNLRIHINLLRPITMLLTTRPPSLYDTLQKGICITDQLNNNNNNNNNIYSNQQSMFWIERGTTTLLYININSTTSDVITQLLGKFNIKNNPHRFALYMHVVKEAGSDGKKSNKKPSKNIHSNPGEILFQKLSPSQCPLKIMLNWCEEGKEIFHQNVNNTRFVLQENDLGGVDWDEFSIPELTRFLSILNSQENEKREEIAMKFELRKKELYRLLELKTKK